MADERKRYSSYRAAAPAGDRTGGELADRGRHGGSEGRDDRPRRPQRRGRADFVVWLILFIVAVATVAAAFTIPLAGQKNDAGASPKASSSPTPSSSNSPSPSPSSGALARVVVADRGDVMGPWGVDSAIRANAADYMTSVRS